MTLKSTFTKLAFKVAKYTVLKSLPEQFTKLSEHAFFHCSKTEELPFKHAQINGSSRLNGLVLPPIVTEEQLEFYATFKPRPDDIFVITYPKSGTVWLGEILHNIAISLGNESPFSKMSLPFEGSTHELLDPVPSPRYIVTHLPLSLISYSNNNGKYIYLARNPKDVAVSYFYFMRWQPIFDFEGTWDEFLEYFMKGDVPYGSHFDHILDWWMYKDNENVLFLKYEDLKKDLKGQVKIITEFLGFYLSDEEAETVAEKCTFQAMKANPNELMKKFSKLLKKGSHLRKGIVGDWKNHFSEEQLEAFQKLYQSRLDGTGLEFEFEADK